jgi:uncharacterized tellurite resistance protein B-like protein
LLRRAAPYIELLYLVMLADGRCDEAERTLLWGAARALSGDLLSRASFDAALETFDGLRSTEGLATRLDSIAAWLASDRMSAEAAFALAAAMVVVDHEVESHERDLLGELAARLGISSGRAEELLGRAPPQLPSA